MPIDSYYKIKVLGQGSFGKVYLVKTKIDGKYYGMKVMNMKGISPADKEATRKELVLMQRLTHPNIISYIEHFLTPDLSQLSIVMTYCDGGDLQGIINKAIKSRRYIKETIIVNFFVQILLGLEFMHRNKVIHRDIKAQNIFLLGNGRLVLGDLGISTILEKSGNLAKTKIGTPYYMSPEIYQDKPYDYKCDIWALGCVLYELLTLRHPFDGKSMVDLCKNITTGFYKPISNQYNKELHDLISIMLSKDPNKRPSLSEIISMKFITQTTTEYIVSIIQRPSSSIGDGTMIIKRAAVKAIENHGIDLNTTSSRIPLASPQITTLMNQLEDYNITIKVIEKLDKINVNGMPVPPKIIKNESKLREKSNNVNTEYKEWNQEQNRVLLREIEKKKALELALEKLKAEKEARLERLKQLQQDRLEREKRELESKHYESKVAQHDEFPPDFEDDEIDSNEKEGEDELDLKEKIIKEDLNQTSDNYAKLKDHIEKSMQDAGLTPKYDTGVKGDEDIEIIDPIPMNIKLD